jgi:CheY-like chemotaxis protein
MSDTMLEDLRDRFRETARIRVMEMKEILEGRPTAEAVEKLNRHFHFMAGMGGTYGFPRISEMGDEVEGRILDLVKAARLPDAATLGRWREVVEEIESVLAVPPEPQAPSPLRATSVVRDTGTRRIVAVEDDATTAVLIRGMLRGAGYEVEICDDPQAFEATLLAFDPDLVLMDVQLSGNLTGLDLLKHIRQNARFDSLPVIIVTSDTERRTIQDSTSAGADLLVVKPVDWDYLLSEIASRLR